MKNQVSVGISPDRQVRVTVESDVRDFGPDDLEVPRWINQRAIVDVALAEYERQREAHRKGSS